MRKLVSWNNIQKIWAYLGVFLMLGLTFSPLFNYLKFPERAQANASTTWTKSGSNPVLNNTLAGYPRVLKESSAFWSSQNANTNLGSFGGESYTSMVVDSSDHLHIAYFDDTPNSIKHAYYDGASWTNTTIEITGSSYISSPAMTIDSTGKIYVSYKGSNGKLKYAKSTDITGSSWSTSTIEVNDDTGDYSAIAIDSSNNIHISYYDNLNSILKYAKSTNGGTSWDYTTVDSSANVSGHSSIAANSSGNARISYYDDTNDDLKYASFNGASWDVSTIVSSDDSGKSSSIYLDTSNNPHIVYRYNPDGTTTDYLKYIYHNGTSWSTPETVDSGNSIALSSSSRFLVMDSSNNLYVSYEVGNFPNFSLKYAVNTGSGWTASTIDSSGVNGIYSSIDLDSSNNPYISYYSDTSYYNNTTVLKYAVGGQHYRLWAEENGTSNVRHASSADGINWNSLQAITNTGASTFQSHEASYIKDGDTYKMWYNGFDGLSTYTGYRTSSDGLTNWSDETVVTYDVTKAWDGDRITPYVFKDGSTYRMYYNANEGNGKYYIAYATSSNGTSWTEPQNLGQVIDVASGTTNNNLVLKQGDSGTWEGFQGGEAMYSVTVIKNSANTYEMWYAANQNSYGVYPYYQIGYATSSDATSFTTSTKYAGNPVLSIGASGWDSTGVMYPNVIEDGSTYKMWYTNNWSGKLGYATAPTSAVTPTASITSPTTGSYYKASNIPTTFTGSAADGAGGTGLNANSTTFYIQRTSDNHYWDGSDWDATSTQWLATTHGATSGSGSTTWASNVTLPTWSSGTTYKTAAKATNKASQTYTTAEITYYYDSVSPDTGTVTAPVTATYYKASSIPATFTGVAADAASGFGLNANSTQFYIKNSSDQYWTGATWSGSLTWLATTHSATTNDSEVAWSSNATFPTWTTGTTYYTAARVVDKADNSYQGSEITYYYDAAVPQTASVTTPTDGTTYNTDNMPATFSGSAADDNSGFGLNANSTTFYLQRTSDNHYWDGSDWDATTTQWLATTHDASTGGTAKTWTDNITLPTWVAGSYKMAAKATDKATNTTTGTEITFTYSPTAPAAITDVTVDSNNTDPKSVLLTWTAPAKSGGGGAVDSYTIKYSTSLITEANFDAATTATVAPTPSTPGQTDSMTITGLTASTKYYFAIKSFDGAVGSGISNVPDATTFGFFGFTLETVDSGGVVGDDSAIATDSNNFSHISYYDSTNANLNYATNTSGSWVTTAIDSDGSVGSSSAIAIDSQNYPHIAYYDATNKNLKYAYKDGTGWHISTIDSTGDVGSDPSIALDSNNKAHISYWDESNEDLKYITNASGSWVATQFISTDNNGQFSSIDVDSSNRAHIAYIDYTHYFLKYVYYNGTDWTYETVDNSGQVGWDLAMKLDSNNKPHLGYYDYVASELKYANKTGASWSLDTVDSTGEVGKNLYMALDYNNIPHFSYYKFGGDGGFSTPHNQVRYLKYAYMNDHGDGTYDWVSAFIDSSVAPDGEYPYVFSSGIAMTTDGRARISYYDVASKDLKFAYNYLNGANSVVVMNDYYNSSNWVEVSSIHGYASGVSLDQVQVKIQRLSDSYYWNGATFVEADPGWQNATGTNSWTYSLASSNLTNATSYTVSTRAHDSGGYGSTATDTFMYNNFNWVQYRINPLSAGTNFSSAAGYPNIIKDGSTFKMWYSFNNNIYYSTSTNGINWVGGNSGSPVLSVGAGQWDSYFLAEPWVVKDGSTYKMWYSATNSGAADMKIGYATSADGIIWTKSGSNPIVDKGSGSAWDNRSVRRPIVIRESSTSYKMWYDGTQGNNTAYNVGYATSTDGVSWTKSGSNPVLSRSASASDWDYSNIWAMSVFKRNGQYEMYFTGNGATGAPDNGHKIGYAYSTNGTTWTKYSSNPIITHGVSSAWNETDVYSPFVYLDTSGDTPYYRLWYNGSNISGTTRVGYATMDAPADSVKPLSGTRFDQSADYGWMTDVDGTYYSGPIIFNDTYALLGDASDSWGIEKVETTLMGNDNKYWTGASWSDTLSWLFSSTLDGFMTWYYGINDSNFTTARIYTLQSKATDGSQAANAQTSFGSGNFTWDSVKPTATLTQINGATPKTYYNSDLFSIISGTASDATSGVYEVDLSIKRSSDNKYWRNATANWNTTQYWDDATGTTSWTYSDVIDALKESIRTAGDGITYTIYTAGVDKVYNNYDLSSSTTTQFIYDGTAPTSSLSFSRSYYNASNWPGTISGTASDVTSGVASVQVKIKNTTDNTYWTGATWGAETWLDATGTTSWSYTLAASNLASGKSYTVYSKATDNAQNVQTSYGSASFGYDTATPTTPTVYDGTSEGAETSEVESLTTLSANWTAATSAGGSDISYEYAIGTTSGGTNVVSWISTGTTRSFTNSSLSLSVDQAYYVSVRATNGAGTTGSVGTSSGQTVVDHTAPTVTLSGYPSNPTNDSTPTFTGTATDAMTNITTVEYNVDNGSWNTAWSVYQTGLQSRSINFSFTTSALANGSHTVYVRATDSKSNTSTSTSYTFTVDASAPATPTITYPTSGEVITTSTPTITGTAEAETTISLTVNSETKTYSTTTNSSGNWSLTIPSADALAEGEHSLEAKATDSAGNTSGTSSITFTVKTKTSTPTTTAASTSEKKAEIKIPTTTITSQNVEIPITAQNQEVQVLVNSQFGIIIKPSLDREVSLVTIVFEGKTITLDKQPDGTYTTNILSPSQKGSYSAKAKILYKDGRTEELDVVILVDPYGYAYEKTKAGEQHLAGVKVTLYFYQDGKWVVWDGSKYNNQANPQTTKDNGEYGFMVPTGKYYLTAEKKGYLTYKGKEFIVEQGKPVNANIQLSKTSSLWWVWVLIGILIVGGGIGIYYYRKSKAQSLNV